MPDETTPNTDVATGPAEPAAPAADPAPTPTDVPSTSEPYIPETNPAWFSTESKGASLEGLERRVADDE